MTYSIQYGISWGTGYAERTTTIEAETTEAARSKLAADLAAAGLDFKILTVEEVPS